MLLSSLRWLVPVPSFCASWPSLTGRTLALQKVWSHCASAWSSWPSPCPWVWTAATQSTRQGTSDLVSSPLWPAGAWRCSGNRACLIWTHHRGYISTERLPRPLVYYSGPTFTLTISEAKNTKGKPSGCSSLSRMGSSLCISALLTIWMNISKAMHVFHAFGKCVLWYSTVLDEIPCV